MTRRLSLGVFLFASTALTTFLAVGPGCGIARAGAGGRITPFVYRMPRNVLRGQVALERLGLLKRGDYSPGEVNQATRHALLDYQRAHSLRETGLLDWDTFALLPIDERPDKDDDGVPDAVDACPGSKKDARVGHDGCPFAGS